MIHDSRCDGLLQAVAGKKKERLCVGREKRLDTDQARLVVKIKTVESCWQKYSGGPQHTLKSKHVGGWDKSRRTTMTELPA